MKNIKYVSLTIALVSFALQMYDVLSYKIAFSLTMTFVLVMLQMVGLLHFAYLHRASVKDPKRFIDIVQVLVFVIYIIDLSYELFFNPGLRHVADTVYPVNIYPFHTISLFITASVNGTLTWKTVILNLVGNLALFVPMGYFLYIFFEPCRKFVPYTLTMFLIISFCELSQVYFHVGTGDVDDIILNLFGGVVFWLVIQIPPVKKVMNVLRFRR